MKPFFLLLLLVGVLQTGAQVTLKSKLADSLNGTPVAFATIGILKAGAAKPLHTILSASDGTFTLTVNDTSGITIIITHTSYQPLAIPYSKLLPPIILLSPAVKTNKGVTVSTSVRPLVEKIDDKLVYNVEADVSLDGQMATDALRKVPFVSVDGEGNVTLKGQSNFKILINGRESAMFTKNAAEALKSFPAGVIKKIEVITNPSSKYDAEGVGGVINIITQKKVTGYNAVVGLAYNWKRTAGLNTTLNVKRGKLGFAGFVSFTRIRYPFSYRTNIIEPLHPQAYDLNTLSGSYYTRNDYPWGNLELSFDVDSLHTLSSYLNFNSNKGALYQDRNLAITGLNGMGTMYSLLTDTNRFYNPAADVGLDYIQKFRSSTDKEWSVKFNHQFSHDDVRNNNNQFGTTVNRFVLNNNRSADNQTTLQSDFVLPLMNKQKLELGAKVILRKAASDYTSQYRNRLTDDYRTDAGNSNKFNYRQNVFSTYFTYSFKIKRWGVRLGSRLEHTEVNGNFTSGRTTVKQRYTNLVPSVYVYTKLGDRHDLSFSYAERLRRPYIFDLNPFVSNTDSLNILYGNPQLQAELTHSFEVGYTYLKGSTSINLRLSENYSGNQITRYFLFNNATGVTANFPDNVGRILYTGLYANLSTRFFNKWTISVNAGGQYTAIRNNRKPQQRNQGLSGDGNISNAIDLTKKFTLTLGGGFFQSPILLQGRYAGSVSYTVGTAYRLLTNKLRIAITATNFLHPYIHQRNTFRDENFIRTSITEAASRNIGASLRWTFGKLKGSVSRKRGVINDDIQK